MIRLNDTNHCDGFIQTEGKEYGGKISHSSAKFPAVYL